MNNISFKAKIYGLPLEITAKQFEWKTENDKKHEIKLLPRDYDNDKDTFVMLKNGKETITFRNEFSPENPRRYTASDLIHIFDIMKALEARDFINKSIAAKKTKIKQSEFEELDSES